MHARLDYLSTVIMKCIEDARYISVSPKTVFLCSLVFLILIYTDCLIKSYTGTLSKCGLFPVIIKRAKSPILQK